MAASHPSSSSSSTRLFWLTVAVLLAVDACAGQTFHYSHGWTNGKRSGMSRARVNQDFAEGAMGNGIEDSRQNVRSIIIMALSHNKWLLFFVQNEFTLSKKFVVADYFS